MNIRNKMLIPMLAIVLLSTAAILIAAVVVFSSYIPAGNSAIFRFVVLACVVAAVALALAALLALLVTRRIVRPIKAITSAADRLAAGEADVEVPVDTKDELHDLASAFRRVIAGHREQAQIIGCIAEGDLTTDVALRGDKDSVGLALRQMLSMNNSVLGQISVSSSQMASSSGQISAGAQNLAQGSAEQAVAVQELSSCVATVASKARENADLAEKASALSDSIRKNAEAGWEQMQHLTEAVNEISKASKAISQVIKVIDDIAFQTNILALNAAVEAARAGEHGKGFAVVAGEVRSLAGRSAEAAKDTGEMIASSMKKAELGARIAGDTAASLSQIVEGINESSQMINTMAISSFEASEAIGQVNMGIEQVAQVVRQNSATAEESAAASEEMNGQSEMLRNLVGQFRLTVSGAEHSGKGATIAFPALPVHSRDS